MILLADIKKTVMLYGEDIINSPKMQLEKQYMQHGVTTVFEHSVNVAYLSIYIMRKFNICADERALVRGALLHDYFLYDWHIANEGHNWHGFTHASKALKNAKMDYALTDTECDIIKKHMFPLNFVPPSCPESAIVCIADKFAATYEMLPQNKVIGRFKYKLIHIAAQ